MKINLADTRAGVPGLYTHHLKNSLPFKRLGVNFG
jgi:hypothetical protein